MTDSKTRLVANGDDSNWTTPPSPVDPEEARKADAKVDRLAAKGQGPAATNEVKHGQNVNS